MQPQLADSPQSASHAGRLGERVVYKFSPAATKVPGIMAELGYLKRTEERPFRYMYEPPAGRPWHNCECQMSSQWIANARAMSSSPSIHVEGFELWDAPISGIDFRDEQAIKTRYYPEAAELAIRVTGADRAYIFDHTIRRREAGRPNLNFGREGNGSRPGAVGRVHIDYSEMSGQKRFEIVAAEHQIRSPTQRFSIVNIWRSIRGKILDTPLAVCDARTVSATDLVPTDIHYLHRSGEIYLVQHSPLHKWAYFPEMDRHEALVFKQYDSQVSGIARFTPHTAFDLPEIPPGAPLRESIEIRCVVTYG